MKNSSLLLCLLCVPMMIRTAEEAGFLNKCYSIASSMPTKIADKAGEAAVTLAVLFITKKYLYDFTDNGDRNTYSQASTTAIKLHAYHSSQIHILLDKKDKQGLTEEEEKQLIERFELKRNLEISLSRNTEKVTKILDRELEHGGFVFNKILRPLNRMLPG